LLPSRSPSSQVMELDLNRSYLFGHIAIFSHAPLVDISKNLLKVSFEIFIPVFSCSFDNL
jgi:hypothetical protein